MATDYNKDAWRLVEKKVVEEIAKAIAEHEAKAEGDTFANSHVVSAG